MEEMSEDTSALASDLFDRQGRLREDHKRTGSIWQEEMDSGDLLLVKELWIHPRHRSRGLGRRLFRAIMDKWSTKENKFIAVAFPSFLQADEYSGVPESHRTENAIAFLESYEIQASRRLGMVRVLDRSRSSMPQCGCSRCS
jgi:GNAT superfamily N-acetyltransferase